MPCRRGDCKSRQNVEEERTDRQRVGGGVLCEGALGGERIHERIVQDWQVGSGLPRTRASTEAYRRPRPAGERGEEHVWAP